MGGGGRKKKREHIIAFSPVRAATAPPPLLPLLIEKQSSDEFSPSYTVSPPSPMLYVHRDVGIHTRTHSTPYRDTRFRVGCT